MHTHSFNLQICNVPPKILINLFIFILINLKCSQAEDPYYERCWTAITNYIYQNTYSVNIKTLQSCKDYCQYELPHCNVIVYSFNVDKLKCAFKNSSSPLNYSYFKAHCCEGTITTYMQYCDIEDGSCWTAKGDYYLVGLTLYKINSTVEECKHSCLATVHCDIINFRHFSESGPVCYVKAQPGPLHNFKVQEGITSFTLNRTCAKIAKTRKTTSRRTGVSIKSRTSVSTTHYSRTSVPTKSMPTSTRYSRTKRPRISDKPSESTEYITLASEIPGIAIWVGLALMFLLMAGGAVRYKKYTSISTSDMED